MENSIRNQRAYLSSHHVKNRYIPVYSLVFFLNINRSQKHVISINLINLNTFFIRLFFRIYINSIHQTPIHKKSGREKMITVFQTFYVFLAFVVVRSFSFSLALNMLFGMYYYTITFLFTDKISM